MFKNVIIDFVYPLLALISFNAYSQISFFPFRSIQVGVSPQVVAIGDINNDGLNDVVLGDNHNGNIFNLFIFYQNQLGELDNPITIDYAGGVIPNIAQYYIKGISIADVNNDHLNDIVIGYDDNVGIFYQNASGGLSAKVEYDGIGNYRVSVLTTGDLNNDGLTDIAAAVGTNSSVNYIKLYYQSATGFYFDTLTIGYCVEMNIADMNNDGKNDLVFTSGHSGTYEFYIMTQDSMGNLNPQTSYTYNGAISGGFEGQAIGDLNNDGNNDIVVTGGGNSPNARILLWFQDTLTAFAQNPQVIPCTDIPEPVEIADLNCDGTNEIIIAHGGFLKLTVFEQDSGFFQGNYSTFPIPYASHYRPQGMAIGDINNDSKKDVAIADYNNGLIILLNNSSQGNALTNLDTLALNCDSPSVYSMDTSYENLLLNFDTIGNLIIKKTDNYEISRAAKWAKQICYYKVEGIQCSRGIEPFYLSKEHTDTLSTSYDSTLLTSISDSSYFINSTNIYYAAEGVQVFPNPSAGLFHVYCPYNLPNQGGIVQVINPIGKTIEEHRFDNRNYILDLSKSPDGVYFLKLQIEESSLMIKLLKFSSLHSK